MDFWKKKCIWTISFLPGPSQRGVHVITSLLLWDASPLTPGSLCVDAIITCFLNELQVQICTAIAGVLLPGGAARYTVRPAQEVASLPQKTTCLLEASLHAAPSSQKVPVAVPGCPLPLLTTPCQPLAEAGKLREAVPWSTAEPGFHSCCRTVLVILLCSPLQKRVKYLFINLWGKAKAIITFIYASTPSWNVTDSQQVVLFSALFRRHRVGSTSKHRRAPNMHENRLREQR